jgi:V/A-type H+-transporting ATPase subunit I
LRAIIKALEREAPQADADRVKAEYRRLYTLDPSELRTRVTEIIDEVEDRAATLSAAFSDLESEESQLARYEPILKKIQPLARQIVTTGNYDSVALLFERRYKSAIDSLREELDKITHKQYEFQSTDVDEQTTAVILVFAKAYSDAVHKFLTLENLNQIRLPSEFEDMPFDAAFDEIRTRRADIPAELEVVRKELHEMSKLWRDRLIAARDVLIDRISEIEAIPKFGRTQYAFVITGWLPVENLKELRRLVSDQWGEEVIIEQTEIGEGEFGDTPVALKNPKAMEPFQKLINVYGMPKYGTLDPTWMLFVFYPLFFGMIVGDMGYGAIMLGVVLWLRYRFKNSVGIQVATSILGPAATMVIVFGLLYAEAFGDLLGHYLGWVKDIVILGVHLPFHRVELVIPFMLIAIGVGVVHVSLGLVIGVINAVRTKNKHHLWEKGGILAFILGLGAAVALSLPMATRAFQGWALGGQALFAVVAFAGFIFALRGGKVMGAIELIESVAHMASYIRIMAVGLAGAIFADAVNGIVAGMTNIPVLAAFVAILLHGLNFVICAFSPTIHALRLNFLEFFGKFYETGGKEYDPFTKTGGE